MFSKLIGLLWQVPELKIELKLRGLPVSGTKTDLIERLKPFQDNPIASAANNCSGPNTQPSGTPMDLTTTSATTTLAPSQQTSENMSSTPPVSPGSTGLHYREESSMEAQAEALNRNSSTGVKPAPEEQDRRLHEKERQIEELLRKLEQEQKLVEELKMQLEVEKRSGLVVSPGENSNLSSMLASVKTESTVPPNCTLISHTTPTLMKLEDPHPPQVTATPLPQFIISHQGVIGQPQTILTTQHGGTQILLPMPMANNTTTIQLPNTNVKLQVNKLLMYFLKTH